MKKCRPKISKLRTILQDTPYFGPSSATEGGHTLQVFEEKVQASPLELESALRDLKAVHVTNDTNQSQKWFMLEPDYHMRALSMMCNFVEENGWKWYSGEILEKDTVEAVASQSLPQEVAKQVFHFYFEAAGDRVAGYSAREAEICRFFGEYLLQTGTTFHLEEFAKLWQQALPGGEDKVVVDGQPGSERSLFRTDMAQLKVGCIYVFRFGWHLR